MSLTDPVILLSAMIGVIGIGALVGLASVAMMDAIHHLHH